MIAEARLPLVRMARTRRAWLPVVGWSALALVGAFMTKSGADGVLRDRFGFVALPLIAYGVVSGSLGGLGLKASIRPVVLLGATPTRAATAAVGVSCIISAIVSALVGAFVCFFAHRAGDPPLAADLVATAGIAALGGAAYAAFFCAGSAIGKGAMRGFLLALDWFVGSSAGFGSLFVPRGHVASLLGGQQAFELSTRTSSVVLAGLMVAYAALAIRLAKRQ